MMTNQPAAEEENNGNTNNNNYNNGSDMKPEPISAAFVSNQPSRLSQQLQQEQEQQREQQSQQQQVYPYSVKIEQDSKGKAKISIHTYGVDPDATKDEAIRLFVKTQDELKGKGIAVLESKESEA